MKIISITVVHGDPIKVTTPVAGIKPVATETPKTTDETLQYTANITWEVTTGGAAVTGDFAESTSYTATIALIAKTGYTFAGIAANSFTVGSITGTNIAGTAEAETMTITVEFPEAIAVPDKDIEFTTGSVKGPTTTVISINNTSQYSVESYSSYDKSYTYFTVIFDSGIALSNYAKIKFTVITTSGNIEYKDIFAFAYGTGATLPSDLPKTDGKYLIASKTGGNPLAGFGTYTFDLDLALATNLQKDSNSIIVAILVPCDNANKAEYKIKDVKFHN